MIYAIGENKIVRATEDGSAVAEVHFELLRPGVYEITEVLTAGTGEDDTDLEKIMTKTADHMKKNSYRIYTRDPFAKEWFARHPNYADILTANHSSMRRKDTDADGASSDYAEVPRRRKSAAEALSHNRSAEPAPQHAASHAAAASRSAYADDEPQTHAHKGRLRGRLVDLAELPSARSRAVGRVIQWICGFLAALCGILFTVSYFAGSASISESLSSTAQGRIIFQMMSLAFIVYCVLLFLWTISQKRYHTADENLKLDVGRGMIGFLLILAFLSFTGSLQAISEHHITVNNSFAETSMGIIGFMTVLNVYKRYILFAAAAGCVLSMLRKFLGR